MSDELSLSFGLIMKFSQYDISAALKRNIEGQGFNRPTDIQFKCIKPILDGQDVLAIAQTGTGKTAAFAIPILDLVAADKSRTKGIYALILAPTHELARQIHQTFISLGKGIKASAVCVYGGVDQEEQIRQLQSGASILIATPGRMFDLLSQGMIDVTHLKMLVLDEADHMLDLGFIEDIRDLIRKVPLRRQNLFFSATINKEIKKLAYSIVKNPIRIQISPNNSVAKSIDHGVAFIEMDDKRYFLGSFIQKNEEAKILIFVRTKVRAERVKLAMDRVNIQSVTLHGDKSQEEREQAMKSFHTGTIKILITTDVSARGIDVPNVDFVVNYDLPDSSETYIHRVGRTGRAGKRGTAISFCSTEEKHLYDLIESDLMSEIANIAINKADYAATLDLAFEPKNDWKALIKANELIIDKNRKQKKFKKKK
jgi:ATP-dependent RNA helicase RhlE|tara:strand:- start:143 stop:1420 length:1278 start_codon:yes stop_codon:yes gene_type:complete